MGSAAFRQSIFGLFFVLVVGVNAIVPSKQPAYETVQKTARPGVLGDWHDG
jgi:hypothetical protein